MLHLNFTTQNYTREQIFRGATFGDTTSRQAPPAYRTHKLAMGEFRARKEEGDFYALEQRSLLHQPDTNVSVKTLSFLYEISSDYGRSFGLPVSWLLILNIMFYIFYIGVPLDMNISSTVKYTDAVQLTVGQIVRRFNVWTTQSAYSPGVLSRSPIVLVQVLATVQSMISLSLITLFVLAIRRRFKLG